MQKASGEWHLMISGDSQRLVPFLRSERLVSPSRIILRSRWLMVHRGRLSYFAIGLYLLDVTIV